MTSSTFRPEEEHLSFSTGNFQTVTSIEPSTSLRALPRVDIPTG
jgi:hypothetical protein